RAQVSRPPPPEASSWLHVLKCRRKASSKQKKNSERGRAEEGHSPQDPVSRAVSLTNQESTAQKYTSPSTALNVADWSRLIPINKPFLTLPPPSPPPRKSPMPPPPMRVSLPASPYSLSKPAPPSR